MRRAVSLAAALAAAALAAGGAYAGQAAADEGFLPLFDGKSLAGWTNVENAFVVEDGLIKSRQNAYGYLYTVAQYGDFELIVEFKLTPAANNGLALRAPGRGDPAYEGIELQILDDGADEYKAIKPYQVHGSAYGIAPAVRGALKPAGEWNRQYVRCVGRRISVELNGQTILEVDLDDAAPAGKTLDGKKHPGLLRARGFIGLMGHNDEVFFRRVDVKPLDVSPTSSDK